MPSDDLRGTLAGRRVLITGGSSGIGHAMADALLGEGAEVGIVSRRRPEDWEEGPPEDWDPGATGSAATSPTRRG
jgi:NAD(P)-dependent dehydrogenase (short-subunit alcohol dehydrogenase family)